MKSATSVVSALSRRGWRVLGGLVAAALLMPLPAMALTFTSAWQSSTAVFGGPTPTAATFTDTTNGGDDNLFVDMGSYQGKTKTAASAIGLARSINVPSAGEAIDFAQQFASQFKEAGVNLAVAVFDSKGNLVAAPITFSQSNSSTTFTTISANQSVTRTLKGGNYTLAVGIVYNTNNKIGGWKAISKHHFEIDGL